MGLFDFFSDTPQVTEKQVMFKGMQAVKAYQERNFENAARFFQEYFDLKGFGRFPRLDADDYIMTLNLMLSHFYSRHYQECIKACEQVLRLKSTSSDAPAFLAMSYYKLGQFNLANKNWEIAKTRGNDLAKMFDNVSDVKMQGF